jgi:hypothetical protein
LVAAPSGSPGLAFCHQPCVSTVLSGLVQHRVFHCWWPDPHAAPRQGVLPTPGVSLPPLHVCSRRVLGFQVLSKGAQAAVSKSLVAGHSRGCRELQDCSVFCFLSSELLLAGSCCLQPKHCEYFLFLVRVSTCSLCAVMKNYVFSSS